MRRDSLDLLAMDVFREAMLEAWPNRPLMERRQALDKVVDQINLSPGRIAIDYCMGADCDGMRSGPLIR